MPGVTSNGDLFARQTMVGATTSEPAGYDRRWLLFLIPIILLFLGLVAAVWLLIRRKRKQKQRRSVLRNRTLVIQEEEKQREREERRLSRGNSLSSKLSRMTSIKSTLTKSTSQKGKSSTLRHGAGTSEGHARYGSGSTQSHSSASRHVEEANGGSQQAPGELVRFQLVDGPTPLEEDVREMDEDVEREAEAEAATLPANAAKGKAIDEGKRPAMSGRKELSVIGEMGAADGEERGTKEGEEVVEEGNRVVTIVEDQPMSSKAARQDSQKSTTGPTSSSKAARQDSQKSTNGPTSSVSQNSSTNPFSTPTTSSNGHFLDSPITSPSEQHIISSGSSGSGGMGTAATVGLGAAAGLGRRLSGVVRLRQPSPSEMRAKSHSNASLVHRSDSRASARSSTQSVQDNKQSLSGRGTPPVAGNWTYTPKAAQWKSSEVANPAGPSEATRPTTPTNGDAAQAAPSVALSRKPSSGVAGSRFVESFDE